jgi:hypothetical protein
MTPLKTAGKIEEASDPTPTCSFNLVVNAADSQQVLCGEKPEEQK